MTTPAPLPGALRVTQLAKLYGDTAVFSGVDFDVAPGEFVAIVGDSGVGKSTLLNCLAGLDHWDRGHITLGGVDLGALDETARALWRRSHVGFVFQAFHVLPHLDVAQNIALPLMLLGACRTWSVESENRPQRGQFLPNLQPHSRAMGQKGGEKWTAAVDLQPTISKSDRLLDQSDATRVEQMLHAVGLAGLGARLPQQLSGGQLQRVAIARALVHRPALLLADEPTGNLDPSTAARVMDVLVAQTREHGASLVLVTHSEAAAARADRVLHLQADGIRG